MADPSPTIREQAIVLVFEALVAALPDVTVLRNARGEVDEDDAPCLILFDGPQQPAYADVGMVAYTMTLDIEGTVTAVSDALLGPALNALYGRAAAAIGDGLHLGSPIEEVRQLDMTTALAPVERSVEPLATFGLGLAVKFITADGNPYASAS